jgi:C-terminal processing protease CtpA/Prc
MRGPSGHSVFLAAVILLAAVSFEGISYSQDTLNKLQRQRALDMLRDFALTVRKNYYDPTYHGVDLEARIRDAQAKIEKANSLGQAFAAIAVAIEGLHDSHTHFIPPERPLRLDYGYRLIMVGDRCYVSDTRPASDAAEKLHPGDQVMTIEGFLPTRDSLFTLKYYLSQIYPRAVVHLLVRDPSGAERNVEVKAVTRPTKHVYDLTASGASDIWDVIREGETQDHILRQRYVEYGDALMIWKVPEFRMNEDEVDRMWGIARKHGTLILDLRGNPGGYVVTLQHMLGNVLDHDVKVGDRKGRKELKPLTVKSRGSHAFSGKLIVLIDSSSASAAELFTRVIQLEHRGTVLGDRSSGLVMEAKFYLLQEGMEKVVLFGATVTDADLIMTDGRSLEHLGVTPDEIMLPTAADLAGGRDSVLSRAAELAGVKLDPLEGGKMFPVEWLPL